VKNSETEISRWRAPISIAETAVLGFGTVMDGSGAALSVEAFGFDFRNFTGGLAEISSADALGFVFCFDFDFGLDMRLARRASSLK
jgi:hypothetical protein